MSSQSLGSAQETIQNQETLDNSLAMQLAVMFAAVVGNENGISQVKRNFVVDFYENLYPEDIASFFFKNFERLASMAIDLAAFTRKINTVLPYQRKIFCLLSIYEFLQADDIKENELHTARRLADLLRIDSNDLAFVEANFNISDATPEQLGSSNILALRVTGDIETADVFLPFPGLDLVIYKIHNLYCITKKNDLYKVVSDGLVLRKNFSSQISQHFSILINDYSLRYQDLIIYFRNKINQLKAKLYVAQKDLILCYEHERTPGSLLQVGINGSHMTLVVLEPESIVAHNGEKVEGSIYVNLDDLVYVNGFRLDLREVFYYLSSIREIELEADRSSYEISNDIKSDLFIQDALPEKWSASVLLEASAEKQSYFFEPGSCPYNVHLNGRHIQKTTELHHRDRLFLHDHFIELDVKNNVFRKSSFSFRKLVAENLSYRFEDGSLGLDDISFEIEYGELACIMGPSGCGKSTLLSVISGLLKPEQGRVLVDHYNLHKEYGVLKDYFGFVPQDDLLLPNLTVYENLYYHARLRFPDKQHEELRARIDSVLENIRLTEKRDTKVGQAVDKSLSGGERKRLNIGLELISDAEIYFLDEPTSGLSSKDSEKIMELLSNIALSGKIVVVVIHQPGPKLYKMFNKVILLDNGGKLAYFGTSYSALEYFKRHLEANVANDEVTVECPCCHTVQPDILLDSLEDSLRDADGIILGERKYTPEYWKNEYRRRVISSWFSNVKLPTRDVLPPSKPISFNNRFSQFLTLFARNYANKVRDRSNLIITFLEAPFLGAAVGFILKYAPSSDNYTLYTNELFKTFLFIAVIVSFFLSMTNSVDEIIGDTALFMRERMLNTTHRAYIAAKLVVLMLFAIVQNALFVALGFLFLEVKELYFSYVIFLSILSYTGVSIGLFISSLPRLSSKAALNIVPLVLIPQIILGGALIEYEKMNVKLKFYENSPVPEICQLMPSRWAYEGLMVLQEAGNSYDTEHNRLLSELRDLKYRHSELTELYGQARYQAMEERLKNELELFRKGYKHAYGNKNIHDAISVGEQRFNELLEDSGLTRENVFQAKPPFPYPMFVREKVLPLLHLKTNTTVFNALILLFTALFINLLTLIMLKYRERILWLGRKSTIFFIKSIKRMI